MRVWYKFFLYKKSKIDTNLKKDKEFSEHEKSIGGYDANAHYRNKSLFLQKYLTDRHHVYFTFLKKILLKEYKILSLGSGRCISELSLLDFGYNITCSDMEIPRCYEQSKKIFKDFRYEKLNILSDNLSQKFNSIICFSMIYLFQEKDLEIFFKRISNLLENEGLLIVDPGGSEANLFSLIYDKIYLPTESYLVFLLSKLFGRQYFLFKKHQGYKFANKELIRIAKKNGFKFLQINESDYELEFSRSKLLGFLMRKFPKTKGIFNLFGKLLPYVRIFTFKKISEKNI